MQKCKKEKKKAVSFCANVEHMVTTKKCDNQHQKGASLSKQLHKQPSVGHFLKSLQRK